MLTRTPVFAIALLALAAMLAACSNSSASPTATPAPATSPSPGASREDPEAGFRALLDAINRKDYAGVFDGLSAEARATFTQDAVRALIDKIGGADANFSVTLQSVNSRTVNGDQAQLGLTLVVGYQGQTYPLTDVAFMVFEDGKWRLSDHFLQTAIAAAGRGAPPAEPRVFRAGGCVEGDPLGGVYLPSRLKVLDACVTVEGLVREVEEPAAGEGDGDLSFNVELTGDDLRLINDGNRKNMHGWLHMEIVPLDQPNVRTPQVGERVRVTGPWVLDTVHGHNEIHPVWHLEVLAP
ncbi:MAG: nuclear transport factor 2 family protein [Dehalococcoidia bacterium]|nr:MAG: nuclear transport factor 2 family protein [Dehalococcoidia bacterium]